MVARVRGKGTAAGLDAAKFEHVDRSLANYNDRYGARIWRPKYCRGEVKDMHVVRLRFYAAKDLEMTAALNEMFQHAFTQGEFEMAGIVDISDAEDGQSVLTSIR